MWKIRRLSGAITLAPPESNAARTTEPRQLEAQTEARPAQTRFQKEATTGIEPV